MELVISLPWHLQFLPSEKKQKLKASMIFPQSPQGKVICPCGSIVTTGWEKREFLEIFANLLLYFSSRWREPWAKLGLSERCLRGILKGPDNPFRLSSHRRVCSAAASREITRLLSTYKIHLWNGMVLRQTCQIVFVCVMEKKVVFVCQRRSDRKQVRLEFSKKNLCSVFMWTALFT